jgi:hypothetical protein
MRRLARPALRALAALLSTAAVAAVYLLVLSRGTLP